MIHRALIATAVLAWPLHALASAWPALPAAPAWAERAPALQPAGEARLSVWGFDIYDARLWTPNGFRAERWAEQPFALELRYLRAFDGADIARRSLQEIRRAGPLTPAQARDWLAGMTRAFPDVKPGDTLVGLHEPGVGARFVHNGAPTGRIDDPDFSRRFFAIWFGPRTPEPALRDALLGERR